MADAKVTITGDSSAAEEALKNVADELGALDDAVEGLSDSTAGLSSATDSMASQFGKVSNAAGGSSRSVGTASKGFSDLGSVLSTVNPRLGSTVSSLSSASSAAGSLASSIGPLAMGLGGLGIAAGVAVVAWGKYQESVKRAEEEQEKLRISIRNLAIDTNTLEDVLKIVDGALDDLAAKYPTVREAIEGYNAQFADTDAISKANQAYRDSAAALEEAEKAAREAEAAMASHGQTMNAASSTSERHLKRTMELRIAYNEATKAANAARRSHERTTIALDALNEAVKETGEAVENTATSVSKSASDIADGLILAAVRAGDFSRVLSSIGTSGVGAELVNILAQLPEEFLLLNGATSEQLALLEQYRVGLLSGAELARELAAEQQKSLAVLKAEGAEIVRNNEARMNAAAAKETADIAAREAQVEWAAYESQTYQERIAYEKELLDLAVARYAMGATLSAEERGLLEEKWGAEREQEAEIAARMEENQEMLSNSFQDVGAGALLDNMGSIADAFGEAAASGADMGEALGKSSLKAISSIAKQFGAMYMSLGTAMLFTPGQQGQGAGLIGAAIALMAIGGAVGAAGKKPKKDKDGGGGGGDSGNATVVVDTYEREGPGTRARDTGASSDNADRYGIDRGRAWA